METSRAEKRKGNECVEEDVRIVKMETDHVAVSPVTAVTAITAEPQRKKQKIRKQKNDLEKSPLMLFNEVFMKATEFNLESSTGPSHDPEFLMSIILEGERYEGRGRSKKEAKQIIAETVLRSKGLWPVQPVKTEIIGSDIQDGMIQSRPQPQPQPALTREEIIVQDVHSGKNAVSIIHQYHNDARLTIVAESGRSHDKIFTSELVIDDKTYQGTGSSKRAANVSAAAKALYELYGAIHSVHNKNVSESDDLEYVLPQPLADKIGEMVHQKFAQLSEASKEPDLKRKVLAGIVKTLQKGDEVVEIDVISIGTGTKCITGGSISDTGQALNDCHGEVIARRGLCRYLYEQLELALKGKVKLSCFTKKKSGLYALKEGIAFHLYISTSPCGDGRIFSPNEKAVDEPDDRHPQRKTRGLLRTKIEKGEGTIPVCIEGVVQTWDGVLLGERLLTMSCSDKISKWNVVGLQGSLLSHFIEPVYLTSVVLGSLYNFHHITRALYKRLGVIANLPDLYRHNYHLVNRISIPEPRATGKSPSHSLNWCFGNESLESVNASTGKLENGTASQLCKSFFFQKFLALWKKLKRNVPEPATYHDAKQSATNYKQAFLILKSKYESNELGKWVKKPIEQNDF